MKKILVLTVQTAAVWAVVVLLAHAWSKSHVSDWIQRAPGEIWSSVGTSGIVTILGE